MAPRAHHLAVVVRDLEASERFYVGLMGLKVIRRWQDEAGQPRSVWVALGEGMFLAIERAASDGPVRSDDAPGFHCLALGVERADREVHRARLAAAGVSVVRETAYTLYVRDPDNNLVGLSHYPDG